MGHGRRTNCKGGPRPQRVSARGYFRTCPVTTGIRSPGSLSPSHVYACPKISSSTPIKIAELNRQTRVFRNAVTRRKQRTGTRSNRQKIQIWTSDNLGTVSTKSSAFRDAFFAFLPGSAQQVEFAVTHSKQSTATFLPGSRIARQAITSETVNAKACPPWRACAGEAAQSVRYSRLRPISNRNCLTFRNRRNSFKTKHRNISNRGQN
jgi:hypothetical protein